MLQTKNKRVMCKYEVGRECPGLSYCLRPNYSCEVKEEAKERANREIRDFYRSMRDA